MNSNNNSNTQTTRKINIIGNGTYGTVFAKSDGDWAVKCCDFNDIGHIKESVITNSLNHKNTINFFSIQYDQDQAGNKKILFYMPKYYGDLTAISKFDDSNIIHILEQICISLLDAHNKGIVHLDVKETNIFINIKSTDSADENIVAVTDVVVGDWGLSKYLNQLDEHMPDYETVSESHRPPELFNVPFMEGKIFNYDSRVDVWSLGIVLLYLMTGRCFYVYITSELKLVYEHVIADIDLIIFYMNKFVLKYKNPELQNLALYENILNLMIAPYEKRSYIDDILNFIRQNNNSHIFSLPPESNLNSKFKLDSFIDIGDDIYDDTIYKQLVESIEYENNNYRTIISSHISELHLKTLNAFFEKVIGAKKKQISYYIGISDDDIIYASCYLLLGIILVDDYRQNSNYGCFSCNYDVLNTLNIIMFLYNHNILDELEFF
jgi:serine/threonine protein kinase